MAATRAGVAESRIRRAIDLPDFDSRFIARILLGSAGENGRPEQHAILA